MKRALLVVVVLSGCKDTYKMPSSSMLPTIGIDEKIKVSKGSTVERGDIVVFHMPCSPDRKYVKRAIALGGDTVEVRCGVVHVNSKPIDATLVEASTSYEDRWDTGQGVEVTRRSASRYRETNNGRTYDIFDNIERPTWKEPPPYASKDFPMEDRLPGCASQPAAELEVSPIPAGNIVKAGLPDGCKPYAHFVVPADTMFMMGDNRDNSNDSRFWGVVPMDHVVGVVD